MEIVRVQPFADFTDISFIRKMRVFPWTDTFLSVYRKMLFHGHFFIRKIVNLFWTDISFVRKNENFLWTDTLHYSVHLKKAL